MTVSSKQHERERQVEEIIRKHPEALNDYRALLIWYWTDVNKAFTYDPKTATFSIHS